MSAFRKFRGSAAVSRRGFTLIELLTVVAIIAVLAALVFPIVGGMKRSAYASQCAGNLRQIGVAVLNFAAENDGMLLPSGKDGSGETYTWVEKSQQYLTSNVEKDKMQYRKFSKVSYCPEWYSQETAGKKVAMKDRYNTYTWATGYTINDYPLYPDVKTANRQNVDSNGNRVGWTNYDFRLASITYKSVRPQVMDGTEWQTGTSGTYTSFNRHGTNKCNVLFFDQHVEMCTKQEIVDGMSDPIKIAKEKES